MSFISTPAHLSEGKTEVFHTKQVKFEKKTIFFRISPANLNAKQAYDFLLRVKLKESKEFRCLQKLLFNT